MRKPGKEQRKRRKLNPPAEPGSEPVPGPSSSIDRDPDNPGVSRDQPSSRFVVSREQARSCSKKTVRILSYDEMIEGRIQILSLMILSSGSRFLRMWKTLSWSNMF